MFTMGDMGVNVGEGVWFYFKSPLPKDFGLAFLSHTNQYGLSFLSQLDGEQLVYLYK